MENDSLVQEDGDDINKQEEEVLEASLSLKEGGDSSGKEVEVGCNEDGDNWLLTRDVAWGGWEIEDLIGFKESWWSDNGSGEVEVDAVVEEFSDVDLGSIASGRGKIGSIQGWISLSESRPLELKKADDGEDIVAGCMTSLPLKLEWSCNKAVMPRAEGALWYLNIGRGEPCIELRKEAGVDNEGWGILWVMILDWGGSWRATCNSEGSIFDLSEPAAWDSSEEGWDFFVCIFNRGLPILSSDVSDSKISFSTDKSSNWFLSKEPELTSFSWSKFEAVIFWSTLRAASAFGLSQSTLLKISWTLANASIGRPSFSSIFGNSTEISDAEASISEKRTFIQTHDLFSLEKINTRKK